MSVQLALDKFGKRVVKESRTALTKKKKNASKSLYNSIGYKSKVSKNSFELSFSMETYGKFIDKGVKGVGGTKANGKPWKKKKVTNNLYKYTNKKPPASAFNNWIVRKGIAPRDSKGRFIKRQSLNFLIARSIKSKGIRATLFFTKPFERGLDLYGDEIVAGYLEDKLDLQ